MYKNKIIVSFYFRVIVMFTILFSDFFILVI